MRSSTNIQNMYANTLQNVTFRNAKRYVLADET